MKRHKDMDIEKSIKRNGIEATEKEIEAGREIISEKGIAEKQRNSIERKEENRIERERKK
jgi:hypothetical protein